jgi:glycosyltransferase involved in cell wall biosynthesis
MTSTPGSLRSLEAVPVPAMHPRRILIVSDAWEPQVNGVVRTLRATAAELQAVGHAVEVIGPDRFRTLPCPSYPSIRLALRPGRRLGPMIEGFAPDALHIATEGPLGWAARAWALRRGLRFTTAFHTRFPEYLQARLRLPPRWSYALLRQFHAAGDGVMVATESLRRELAERGFRNIRAWARGVDLDLFRPDAAAEPAWPAALPRPVLLHVGRVAVEKNIAAFLDLDLPGSKVVVGDGPQLAALRRRYPDTHFAGALHGVALAAAYARADALVFPSRTDTFGLVLLEALACGTPVAAYPVTGPLDVLDGRRDIGALHRDLRTACQMALGADRAACRAHAECFSWRACTEIFAANLVPAAPPH